LEIGNDLGPSQLEWASKELPNLGTDEGFDTFATGQLQANGTAFGLHLYCETKKGTTESLEIDERPQGFQQTRLRLQVKSKPVSQFPNLRHTIKKISSTCEMFRSSISFDRFHHTGKG